MRLNQANLSRLQLFGTLLIIFLVATSMSGYFMHMHRLNVNRRMQADTAQARQRTHDRLKANNDQIARMFDVLCAQARATLRQRVREQADQAFGIASSVWQRERGRRPDDQIGRMIIDTLRPLRFHQGQDHYLITTLSGQPLLPGEPKREGGNLLAVREDTGRLIMRDIITAAQSSKEGGFSYYRWMRPGTQTIIDKITYVRRFSALNWVIGASEPVMHADHDLQHQILDLLTQLQPDSHSGFIIIDATGKLLHYPAAPALVEKPWFALPPPLRATIRSMMSSAHTGGYLSCSQNGAPVLAYASPLPEWGWTLVTTRAMQPLIEQDRQAHLALNDALRNNIIATLGITLAALGVGALFSWLFARGMNALLSRLRRALRYSHQELTQRTHELLLSRSIVDHATDIICLMDSHARLAYQNEMARTYLGDVGHQRDKSLARLFFAPDAQLPQTYRITLPDPVAPRHFEVTQTEILFEGEHYRAVSAHDITAIMAAKNELRLAARVFDTSLDAIMFTDRRNRILKVNQAFLDRTGYRAHEVLGNTPSMQRSGYHSRSYYDEMWKTLHKQGQWSGEIWNRRRNGDIVAEWLSISALYDDQGKINHYVAHFNDLVGRLRPNTPASPRTGHDTLTGLPNQTQIHDRLLSAILATLADGGEMAVLSIDLDHFKEINDTLGYAEGDELLKAVATRLRQLKREEDTVGRRSDDEFIMIQPKLHSHEEAAHMAKQILHTLRQPFLLPEHGLSLSASIGISLLSCDGQDARHLLDSAGLAMYHAKACGRNTFRFYSCQLNAQYEEHPL